MSRYETPWALRARPRRAARSGAKCPRAAMPRSTCALRPRDAASGLTAPTGPLRAARTLGRERAAAHLDQRRWHGGRRRSAHQARATRAAARSKMSATSGDEYNYSPPASDRRVTSADATKVRVTRLQTGRCARRSASTSRCRLPAVTHRRPAPRAPPRLCRCRSASSSRSTPSAPRVAWHVRVDNRSPRTIACACCFRSAPSDHRRARRNRVRRGHASRAPRSVRNADAHGSAGQLRADRRLHRSRRRAMSARSCLVKAWWSTRRTPTGCAASRADAATLRRVSVARRPGDAPVGPRRARAAHAGRAVPGVHEFRLGLRAAA